jgi:AmmeMemoRadiSam system protein B
MESHWKRDLIREPVVEGLFYPEDPAELLKAIKDKILHARTVAGNSRGIIVPNASFDFIAGHCAEGYKRAEGGEYRRIVIIAPYRREGGDSFLLPESTLFRSPLGISRVDTDALDLLISSATTADISEVTHLQEHGIEIHLPWLQAEFPDVPIVPVLYSSPGIVGIRALSSALQALEIEDPGRTLYVASINLTPALPADLAERQAGDLINLLLEGRWEEIAAACRRGDIRGSGAPAAAVLSAVLHRHCRIELLSRGNSAEYDKNESSVVEYGTVTYEHALASGGTIADAAD